jgi:hypothetical protein
MVMTITWTKTSGCSLRTEVGTTKNFGDVGYIYKDGSRWASVYTCEDGQEMDTSCGTKEEAKKSIVSELAEEIELGRTE